MCYSIQMKVVLQNDIPSVRSKFSIEAKEGVKVGGAFPTYDVSDGHCACDFVSKEGDSLKEVLPLIESVVQKTDVKRVEIIWFWGSSNDLPKDAPVSKLPLSEFSELNRKNGLEKNHWYRINDASRFQSN